jgi:hypothetical protein
VIVFFVVGAWLLSMVDEKAGAATARAADEATITPVASAS